MGFLGFFGIFHGKAYGIFLGVTDPSPAIQVYSLIDLNFLININSEVTLFYDRNKKVFKIEVGVGWVHLSGASLQNISLLSLCISKCMVHIMIILFHFTKYFNADSK